MQSCILLVHQGVFRGKAVLKPSTVLGLCWYLPSKAMMVVPISMDGPQWILLGPLAGFLSTNWRW